MTSPNTSDKQTRPAKSAKWSRRKLFAIVGATTLVAAGAFATTAQSGSGFFRHGMMGHQGFMQGAYDPGNFEEHLDKKLKHFAIEFDATEAQQEKLKTVITQWS